MSDNSNGSGGFQLTPWTLKYKICCMGQELECHETKTFKSSSFMTVQIRPSDASLSRSYRIRRSERFLTGYAFDSVTA